MVDAIQILLTVVISVLTVLLTIIGLAVFQILKEFKKSIEKINFILDDTHRMTAAVAEPVEEASEFLRGIKSGVNFVKTAARVLHNENRSSNDDQKNSINQNQPSVNNDDELKEGKKKKFFRKAGKILNRPI
jgi:biopolymer transport protein ExbB/TolQ